jgi:hypothetical protein
MPIRNGVECRTARLGAIRIGPYDPAPRHAGQALFLTRGRCAFDRVLGPVLYRRANGILWYIVEVEDGSYDQNA